jgi:hypothetical protein
LLALGHRRFALVKAGPGLAGEVMNACPEHGGEQNHGGQCQQLEWVATVMAEQSGQ